MMKLVARIRDFLTESLLQYCQWYCPILCTVMQLSLSYEYRTSVQYEYRVFDQNTPEKVVGLVGARCRGRYRFGTGSDYCTI